MIDGETGLRAYLHPDSRFFGRPDAELIAHLFVAAARRFQSDLLRLIDDFRLGHTNLSGFVARSERRVREIYLLVYSLGVQSVDPFHTVTQRDVRIVNRHVDGEADFLRQFGYDLRRGTAVMDPVVRAGLYIRSLRGIFELGRIEAIPGPYEWVLGDTEHCLPCIEAAAGGPYQREPFSGLGYPPLPGIPGDGSVCQGLTRCGCTLQLTGGSFTPNSDLQERIRDLLASVVAE